MLRPSYIVFSFKENEFRKLIEGCIASITGVYLQINQVDIEIDEKTGFVYTVADEKKIDKEDFIQCIECGLNLQKPNELTNSILAKIFKTQDCFAYVNLSFLDELDSNEDLIISVYVNYMDYLTNKSRYNII